MALFNPTSVSIAPVKSDVSTSFTVAAAIASTALLAINLNRRGATIFNDSTARLYVKFGTAAATSNFTVILEAGGYYEVPYTYTGAIAGIWTAANGNARIEELT
jgi:hypothetical protein